MFNSIIVNQKVGSSKEDGLWGLVDWESNMIGL